VVLNGSTEGAFWSRAGIIQSAQESIARLEGANQVLLEGDKSIPACFGFDEAIDRLNLQATCESAENSTDAHEVYRCLSASNLVSLYSDFVLQIVTHIDDFDGSFRSRVALDMIHMMASHAWPKMSEIVSRLSGLTEVRYRQMLSDLILLSVVGVAINIAAFLFALYIQLQLRHLFRTALMIMKRVSPLDLIDNKHMMDFIMNRSMAEVNRAMPISQSAIHYAKDVIICTTLNGIIEMVNPAAAETFFCTPEQLLGQSISILFVPESIDEIAKEMALRKTETTPKMVERNFECMNGLDKIMTCGVFILGIQSEKSRAMEALVFIIRDKSEVMEKQKETEKAKTDTEAFLQHIVPVQIINRMRTSGSNNSFSVNSASVIFVDISRFSEYFLRLSPQETIEDISNIFSSFEKCLQNYPALSKIKVIGDTFIAAGSLLEEECSDGKAVAQNAVEFGLQCMSEIEEINQRRGSDLALKVSIVTGGPLVVALIGDKPLFDIIGFPLLAGARLLEFVTPGSVMICAQTYQHLADRIFLIEPNGQVSIKGMDPLDVFSVSNDISKFGDGSHPKGIIQSLSGYL
jgi:guanylate cyclase